MKWSFSALFIVFGLITACSSAPKETVSTCQNYDWYEMGRRDGTSGTTLAKMENLRRQCGNQFSTEAENMYRNGRNAGLVEYCSNRNGFELGRLKVSYNAVCPRAAEEQFLQSYKKGEQARLLEFRNHELSTQIDQLSSQLNDEPSLSPIERGKISSSLELLKREQSENGRRLNQMAY